MSRHVPDRCRDQQCSLPLVPRGSTAIPPDHAEHGGRGLCKYHYDRARDAGVLEQYPPVRRSALEVRDRWIVMRQAGHTYRSAAIELGLSIRGLRAALERADTPPVSRGPVGWSRPALFDVDTRDEGE